MGSRRGGWRRLGRLRARPRDAAPRAQGAPGAGDDALGRGSRRRDHRRRCRPRPALRARERPPLARRGAAAARSRGGPRGRPPVAGGGSRPSRPGDQRRGQDRARRRLSPENVREAIERVQPWAVDASSSLETEPGVKDHERYPRVRGGGAMALTYGDLRRRRPLRPRDADPGTRRARGPGWQAARQDPSFEAELDELGRSYAGRPNTADARGALRAGAKGST